MRLWIYVILLVQIPFIGMANQIDSLQKQIQRERNDSLRALLYVQLSYQFLTNMELDSCMATAKKGVLLSTQIGNESTTLLNYEFEGQCYYYLGLYRQSIEVFTETLRRGEKIGHYDIMARAHGMLGWIFIEQRRFNDARTAFESSISICTKQKIVGEDLALNYYGLGSVFSYRHSNIQNYKKGELYYDSALSLQPGLQIRERTYVIGELASLYRDGKNQLNKSTRLLKEAELLIREDKNHNDVYAYILAELAYNYSLSKDYSSSRIFANKAVAIYDQLPFKRKMTSVYELLAETYNEIGDSKKAFQMEQLNRILSDSIYSLRNIELVEEINAQFESEKRQREIQALTQSNLINALNLKNSHRTIIIMSGGSAAVLILVSLIFYNRNRYQRRIKEVEMQQMLNEEKQRIAKDLHDNIGTQLTSLALAIGNLETDQSQISTRVSHLRDNIDATMVELRDTIWAIHKSEVTMLEFRDRVDNLFWRLREQVATIRFIVVFNGDEFDKRKLKPIQAVNLFRVVQEAVNNSLKHSGASEITLTFTLKNQSLLIIRMSDNGKGFDVNESHPTHNHFGLLNIQKRAEEMHGNFDLESVQGQGTTISIRCPL